MRNRGKCLILRCVVAALLITGFSLCGTGCKQPQSNSTVNRSDASQPEQLTDLRLLKKAFDTRQHNVQVTQQGRIVKILADDTTGSRHQRWIVELASGQTLLIAHNIDLAPRVPNLTLGTTLTFHGEYEWNEQGGVVHWTHHDPDGRHEAGWLRYQGETYQ